MIPIFRFEREKAFPLLLGAVFLVSTMISPVQAQGVSGLPHPGAMPSISTTYSPTIIKGMTIYPDNPLQIDFLIDPGDETLNDEAFEKEAMRLIKYFMVSLTIPENEMWVNLSPYEENRIMTEQFGQTAMGQDLLAQDYMLKQLTASLMSPEHDLGKKFWENIYSKIREKYGTIDVPLDAFNKVWIVPDKADVYVDGKTVFVVDPRLKVLLEKDYFSLESKAGDKRTALDDAATVDVEMINAISAEAAKHILLPGIEKEINEGKDFASLRQIYNSLILATWYKKNLKKSLLGEIYVDREKIRGIESGDNEINQDIYERYLEAFKKGVYDYIKEDYDPFSQTIIPRKYFSGGIDNDGITAKVNEISVEEIIGFKVSELRGAKTVRINLQPIVKSDEGSDDSAMLADSNPKFQRQFEWKDEISGVRNVLDAMKLNASDIYLEYQDFLRLGKEEFGEERLNSLKNDIYSIKPVHLQIWGVMTATEKTSAPYFEGSYITALMKTFSGLDLNPYAFSYIFATEEDGIKSIHAALERFEPALWEKYQAFKHRPERFTKEAIQDLKNRIYDIQGSNFDIWGLSSITKKSASPYFNGSYIFALQKALPELKLNPYAFRYKFTTEEDGIKSIHAALERFEPALWEEYQSFIRDRQSFSAERIENLKTNVYSIGVNQFQIWNLYGAMSKIRTPYFKGTYKIALIKSLDHLDLNFNKFKKTTGKGQYQWSMGINQGINNIRIAISIYRPDIWEEYQEFLKNRDNFDKGRLRELKDKFYNISHAHFGIWGLNSALNSETAPYFELSYITAIRESFKELDLNPYAFSYKFATEEDGIKSIQAALERFETELWEEYQEYLKNRGDFNKNRLRKLKERVYNLKLSHFLIWGFGDYTFSDSNHYFGNSYITALQKSLPELELNAYAFAYRYETKEDAINSLHAALERFEPELWAEYQEYEYNPGKFTKERLENLKAHIYNLSTFHFRLWKLAGVLKTPYINGSYITALRIAFNKLALNPYAFIFKFTTEKDGVKSFHAAMERYDPRLWEEYQALLKNPENFDKDRMVRLQDEFKKINKPRLESWHLAAALSKKTAPYFEGMYATALQKSFPEIYAKDVNGKTSDSAMLTSDNAENAQEVGGIDLNLNNTELREHGSGIEWFQNNQPTQLMEIEGFYPVILNISPLTGSQTF